MTYKQVRILGETGRGSDQDGGKDRVGDVMGDDRRGLGRKQGTGVDIGMRSLDKT